MKKIRTGLLNHSGKGDKTMRTNSQCDKIRLLLLAGGEISFIPALSQFGCANLKGRIWDLKQRGLPIEKEWRKQHGKRFAVYKLKT